MYTVQFDDCILQKIAINCVYSEQISVMAKRNIIKLTWVDFLQCATMQSCKVTIDFNKCCYHKS